MSKRKNTLLFTILFICVFIYVGNNSDLRVTRRFFISLKIVWILMFVGLDPANAKDNPIIPGAHGFKPPISRPNPKFNNPALGGARQNIGKGVSPAANKPPRAPSGFRVPHKPVGKQGLHRGATGFGGSGSSSSGETIFIDHKGMIDFGSLSDKGIDISGFPSHESVAFNMGKDSVDQKGKFIDMDQGPTSIEEVVHLYNFENIRNRTEIPILMQAVLNGAEQAGYMDGIIFLNYEQ